MNTKDYSSKWDGFNKIWDVEFNGIPLKVSKQNTVGGDDENVYFYWTYAVESGDEYLLLCDQYETGYIEWRRFDIPEGFDWETFRKEVKEALDVELPTK